MHQIIKRKSPFLIAEIGINHNGSLKIALKMVDVAKNCGADAIKFQSFKTENLILPQAPKSKYHKNSPELNELERDLIPI